MMENMLLNSWGNTSMGLPFQCPLCSEESVYFAIACQECETIFHRNPAEQFPDRCPNCSYSRSEDMKNKQREEKERKREEKRNKRK